ncbi:DUF2857 domain-containing protein [Aestuariicella hydrocarbonica]|uniref:DUF2857 domain-containing protein n=2 Tax=Pseudomaricurvus hydrocarbonicus TaxID=1470433 RepID=A0A9E5JQF6_9GAMM|nr:DUF2857 domain-containing protein [Aestuariicella hydrocarbonica]
MSSSKEADLTTAVLMYAMRCLAEGDQQALRAMNFGPKELDALTEMNLGDLYRADALRVHCLHIGLNREVFWPMLEHLRHQRASEELQRSLLVADAPLEMMQQLFGVSSREYTRWRRLLTLAPSVGRPPELSEADTHALWYAWQAQLQQQDGGSLTATDFLSLHHETGIGLRSLWALVQRWDSYGVGSPGEQAARNGR